MYFDFDTEQKCDIQLDDNLYDNIRPNLAIPRTRPKRPTPSEHFHPRKVPIAPPCPFRASQRPFEFRGIDSETRTISKWNHNLFTSQGTSLQENVRSDDVTRRLPSDKNAVMLLHELEPSVQHRLIGRTGELHAPTYSVETEIHGQVYEGRGRTKKIARLNSALTALLSSVQFTNSHKVDAFLRTHLSDTQTFSDSHAYYQPRSLDNCPTDEFQSVTINQNIAQIVPMDFSPPSPAYKSYYRNHENTFKERNCMRQNECYSETNNDTNEQKFAFGVNRIRKPCSWTSVMILSDLRPQTKYALNYLQGNSSEKESCEIEALHQRRMRVQATVTVDTRSFNGYGGCKRMAKERAATLALRTLFDIR